MRHVFESDSSEVCSGNIRLELATDNRQEIAEIHVARESQKHIVVGAQGRMIKRVGMDSRKDIEAFLGKKVFLDLYVRVDKNWRDDERKLKRFGYMD